MSPFDSGQGQSQCAGGPAAGRLSYKQENARSNRARRKCSRSVIGKHPRPSTSESGFDSRREYDAGLAQNGKAAVLKLHHPNIAAQVNRRWRQPPCRFKSCAPRQDAVVAKRPRRRFAKPLVPRDLAGSIPAHSDMHRSYNGSTPRRHRGSAGSIPTRCNGPVAQRKRARPANGRLSVQVRPGPTNQ